MCYKFVAYQCSIQIYDLCVENLTLGNAGLAHENYVAAINQFTL